MCSTRTKRATLLTILILIAHFSASAQDRAGEPSISQQGSPFGRIEVPDTEEQRRFVEEHSLSNPSFRRKQTQTSSTDALQVVQGSKQVRLIYLVPADKSARADYTSAIANAISNLQNFYRNQMGAGYTFSLHSPIVEVYQTPHSAAFYSTGANSRAGGFYENVLADGFALTGGGFNDPNNRWIFYIDADLICGQYTGGTSGIALLPANDLRGLTSQPTVPICPSDHSSVLSVNRWIGGLGHELGHALNLPHPPGCDSGACTGGQYAYNSLMYIGYSIYPNTYLLDENKPTLMATGFFKVLSLDPSGQYELSGTIKSSDNVPLAGATVTLSETQDSVASDSNGSFRFSGLPAGHDFTISTELPGYRFSPQAVLFNNLDRNESVNFTGTPQASLIQISTATYQVGEADGHVGVVVTRTDTSSAASVDYTTLDSAGLAACNSNNGAASSRCDYATSVGTLRFALGEGSKTIFVPLVNDAYTESAENFAITLINPLGATLGPVSTATITINDDDVASNQNPIDQTPFFIRQHYIDFLGREPDPSAQAWQDILNKCAPGDSRCDRIEVSAGFFRSEEFQSRGYFIYRFYSAVGKIPRYAEFVPDFAKVSGYLSAQQLEQNKISFVNEFMKRADFQTKYGSLVDPTEYVDALLKTLGMASHPGRTSWIGGLSNGSMTRAQVLRGIVETAEVYTKYYNEAFVIMQYFGYLGRDADISYLSWIETMNATGGNYRVMIDGFLNSLEYRQKFGP
jgi:hypothetical protein